MVMVTDLPSENFAVLEQPWPTQSTVPFCRPLGDAVFLACWVGRGSGLVAIFSILVGLAIIAGARITSPPTRSPSMRGSCLPSVVSLTSVAIARRVS